MHQALAICVAYRGEGELYQRAATRWLGRYYLEIPGATLEDVWQVAEALDRLPDAPDRVSEELEQLVVRRRRAG